MSISDVNKAGRIRVVAPPYPICWINICPILVLISVGYPLYRYPPIFSYSRVFTDTRGYLQIYLKTNI